MEKLFAHWCCNCSVCFKGRSLSMQQQMMQQSRQLDPNLLMKQQTPPSQQQSLHQPSMKSFLENVIPHTTPELQKGPSPINAFSSFPIGGCPAVSQCLCDTQPCFSPFLLLENGRNPVSTSHFGGSSNSVWGFPCSPNNFSPSTLIPSEGICLSAECFTVLRNDRLLLSPGSSGW